MITIEQYTKISNEFFFFTKNNPIALRENEVKNLINSGSVENMTKGTFTSIVEGGN